MPKLQKNTIYLVGIVVIATILRVLWLNKYPPELFGDELDVGYQAYSLGHTLRDYTGQFLPTYIHSFSEWRAPLFMYALIPFVLLFGLNDWGVRLGPALFGVLSIVLTYILTNKLTNNGKLALLASLLLTILPWHIHYSRAAFEVTLLESLLLLGLIGFMNSFTKPKWLVVTAVSFGLMLYTYSIATVFIPFLVIALLLLSQKEFLAISKKQLLIPAVIFAIICLPLGLQTLSGKAQERFSLISIFSKPKVATNAIEIERNTPLFPPNSPLSFEKNISEKLAHNKPVYYFNEFTTHYLQAFSPQFLYLSGDPNPRESAGGIGELYLFFVILLPLGFYYLFAWQKNALKIILPLLIIAPIPAALTMDGGMQATRLFLLNLPITMIAGSGAYYLSFLAKSRLAFRILLIIVCLLALFNLFQWQHQYIFHNPAVGYKSWQYGYKDSISYVGSVDQNYKRILLTNRGDPTLLRAVFWLQVDPATFHKQFVTDQPKPNILPGFDGFAVGNIYFVSLNDKGKKLGIEKLIDRDTLYLISQEYEVGGDWDWRKDPPAGIKVLHTTVDPFGMPIFYVITRKE